jgi:predicted nuclease with RNAse H fold
MHVVGIDLAGPANAEDTALVVVSVAEGEARCVHEVVGADDARLLAVVADLPPPVVVAVDAPLSYQPGGGDRASDKALRSVLIEAGMPSGSVMTPTMTRMSYLTLRGVVVARLLEDLPRTPRIVEVHPGGALVLRGAPLESLRAMKDDAAARLALRTWLETEAFLVGLQPELDRGDHHVAAAAAAMAGWDWARGTSAWLHEASPPHHPYDFAC